MGCTVKWVLSIKNMLLSKPNITSEVQQLKAVIIHEPGNEVEKVTPSLAQHALYDDILNLSIAQQEYKQFSDVLKQCSDVYTIRELFISTMKEENAREAFLLRYLGANIKSVDLQMLLNLNTETLFEQLVLGLEYRQTTLSNYLKHQQLAINPLHNLFFTRDIGFTIFSKVFSGCMAKQVRKPEAALMHNVFNGIADFSTHLQLIDDGVCNASIEGGDILVFNHETLIIGLSDRTSAEGIDALVTQLDDTSAKFIIVQELPHSGSFIHLDMVFTLLDSNICMVYKPVIYDIKLQTLLLELNNGKVVNINEEENILTALKKLKSELEPVFCGGDKNLYAEREQWHSGANFLALAPGQVIGYERNYHTNEALNDKGFEIIKASDFLNRNMNLSQLGKCVITIEGSELARGGGGPRCMSLPVIRG